MGWRTTACAGTAKGMTVAQTYETVEDYIRSCPAEAQVVLQEIRRRVHDIAPSVDETISYQMPTFRLDGRSWVHVAAWKHHVSLYPLPDTDDESLARDLAPFASGRGTVKFPLREPIPYEVVERMLRALLAQHARDVPQK
jgi:uncharacterized protein YdhG (YjbR/CyaY superfamily)